LPPESSPGNPASVKIELVFLDTVLFLEDAIIEAGVKVPAFKVG
jgi:hypothetical protein